MNRARFSLNSRALFASGFVVLAAPAMPGTCEGTGPGTGGSGGQPPAGVCGNGVREGAETCDGADLPAEGKCNVYQPLWAGGVLRCNEHCGVNTSWCITNICGNGRRDFVGEDCEGEELGFEGRCELYRPDLYPGGTLTCRSDCRFDTSSCLSPTCGDGKRNGDEQCDGAALEGNTCATWDIARYSDGELSCNADCTYNVSGCVPWVCGNNLVEGGEECDGTNLNGHPESCTELDPGSYTGGTVGCNGACQLDTSRCTTPVCGDGRIEADERCDGTNLGGATCANTLAGSLVTPFGDVPVNFISGTLTCSSLCAPDTRGCLRIPGCYRLPTGIICL